MLKATYNIDFSVGSTFGGGSTRFIVFSGALNQLPRGIIEYVTIDLGAEFFCVNSNDIVKNDNVKEKSYIIANGEIYAGEKIVNIQSTLMGAVKIEKSFLLGFNSGTASTLKKYYQGGITDVQSSDVIKGTMTVFYQG
jgi:hypothetical protein